ncbi:MAG: pyrroloquinoline quinone biosynthesis protein PqqB [Sneathiella sp.]|uniref:pyrroloquinoline quinone biosynthesis protein PqqB n=1 Tax=Sneathiella sp. TaxID=1964365 RepID=UPI0030017C3F
MDIIVLGAAAGGGFPQWNCNCSVCAMARQFPDKAIPRTQSSLAINIDGHKKKWVLLNASPDLRQQINDNRQLWPDATTSRGTGIAGTILTNGDVDHICGLVNLRESQKLNLYATQRILTALSDNTVFDVLNPKFVERHRITLDEAFLPLDPEEGETNISVLPFAVPGKVALYLEDEKSGKNFGSRPEDTIGLEIRSLSTDQRFFYVPGCAAMTPDLADRLRDADLVFFDGTLWRDDEMINAGVGIKTGKRMGHMSMAGSEGSLAALANLNIKRKIFVHINNTNPVLIENSHERREAENAGWEISFDGMEVKL